MRLFRLPLLLLIALTMAGCDKHPPADLQAQPAGGKLDFATNGHFVPDVAATYPRYQIVFSPHKAADTFLLDTQKGRIWQLSKFTDISGQPLAWADMDIIDSQGEIGITIDEYLKIHPATGAIKGKGK